MKKGITLFLAAIFILVIACVQSFPGTEEKDFNPKQSVVQIFTTYQKPNYDIPWQMQPHGSKSGSGCIIRGNRIITNAHVVSDQTFIQVRKAGEVDRFVAEVEYIAHDCDLALLTVTDPSFFTNTQSVELGKLPNLRETVSVYGFPIGGNQLAVTEGVVSRIETKTYAHSRFHLLTLQIDARIAAGNSGGPVFKDNHMVGLAFQGGKSSDVAIPVPVIRHFLIDLKDGECNGTPNLGISIQKLENPAMRENLGIKAGQTGLFVAEVRYNTSAWSHLRHGDVLTKINGIPIANDGTIPLHGDRIDYRHIVSMHQLDETVHLDILRNGKAVKKQIKLKKRSRLVPYTQYETCPTFYVYAGIVFMPLTENYIDLWSWDSVPFHMKYYFLSRQASENMHQAIFIAKVLAHDVNIGFQDLDYFFLSHINGHVIKDMKMLKEVLENAQGPYITFNLEKGAQIVIDTKLAKESELVILEKYRVKSRCSVDLE